jgi:iron complex outermembrane receptor protein
MQVQRNPLSTAVMLALASLSGLAMAQTDGATTSSVTETPAQVLAPVIVTATPFGATENAQILTPAKVLRGDELRDRLGNSLGDTLWGELGVNSSGFGAGASRPIIRGMEGPRVKILQNGMSVADVSALSNDHAVAVSPSTARQVEILRGPAALLYGSGAIGGLVNLVNDRIPTMLEPEPTGEAELRHGSADNGKSGSFSLDRSLGQLGLHIDANALEADNYRIPGNAVRGDPSSASHRLPNSQVRQNSVGAGVSLIQSWGHIGLSAAELDSRYGNPTLEGSRIDMKQQRYDLDAMVTEPLQGFDSLRFKIGYTDYRHTELSLDNEPEVEFANRNLESRLELRHKPVAGWRGTIGLQTESARFSALDAGTGGPDALPVTTSRTVAGFIVEERDFGALRVSAGARLESVRRKPRDGDAANALPRRSFNLGSASLGGLWTFTPGYAAGVTASLAQRAPAVEELYFNGGHDATGTYDIGNPDFGKETSHNIELSLQKTDGPLTWKANLYENRVRNYLFGRQTGNLVDGEGNPGDELFERIFEQADATIRGAEAEIAWNRRGPGVSLRGFADTSRARLDDAGNLPLQPASRFGVDAGWRQGAWRTGFSVTRVLKQDRLASSETAVTPAYTRLDANLSWTQKVGATDLTWFALAKNLLDRDMRQSTSVLREIAPQPGRSLIVGVRASF